MAAEVTGGGGAYCDAGGALGGGPPSIEDIDIALPVLGGRPNEESEGSSRFWVKEVGGPRDGSGPLDIGGCA